MSLWYPRAHKRPGPTWKIRARNNARRGVVMHSAEGFWGGNWNEITRPDRDSGWQFYNATDGELFQHYPLDAVVVNAGAWANRNLTAIENGGQAGTPLTEAQIESARELIQWLSYEHGWEPRRDDPVDLDTTTMFEHRDPGVMGAPTACPSDRIPWGRFVFDAEEEDVAHHTFVRKGETLTAVANRVGLSLHTIVGLNAQITNPDLVEAGQGIRIHHDGELPPLIPIAEQVKAREVKTHLHDARKAIDAAEGALP